MPRGGISGLKKSVFKKSHVTMLFLGAKVFVEIVASPTEGMVLVQPGQL